MKTLLLLLILPLGLLAKDQVQPTEAEQIQFLKARIASLENELARMTVLVQSYQKQPTQVDVLGNSLQQKYSCQIGPYGLCLPDQPKPAPAKEEPKK